MILVKSLSQCVAHGEVLYKCQQLGTMFLFHFYFIFVVATESFAEEVLSNKGLLMSSETAF